MNRRSVGTYAQVAVLILASTAAISNGQVVKKAKSSSSATHVSAEMTKGQLNPAHSKPGDMVLLKLKDDVRSNGQVIVRKGTTITGVVRKVQRLETKTGIGDPKSQPNSMMEIEWLAPVVQSKVPQNVSIALQSVRQINPSDQHQGNSASDDSEHGGLSGGGAGATGRVLSATTGVGTSAAVTASSAGRESGRSNTAMLSMPSVVAVDGQTSSAIESSLGGSSSGQLFKVGHGQMITAGGSQQSVDLFSHLSNDTVITSASKNFEISSGAQMQLLVGVNRK